MSENQRQILLILALAVTALWVALCIAISSAVRGTGREVKIGLGWLAVATVLWVAWSVTG